MIKVRCHRGFNFILLKITVPFVEINLQKKKKISFCPVFKSQQSSNCIYFHDNLLLLTEQRTSSHICIFLFVFKIFGQKLKIGA